MLANNPRFYILVSTVLLSIASICFLRITTISDQLFLIRTQQLFGFWAIFYWYVALLITPLQQHLGKRPFMQFIIFCRRAIGVSAAYFALLHVGIALWGQIGGIAGLNLLPPRFLAAIILGGIALIIVSAMAITSFDKVIAFMTFKRWKFLHRFGYLGGILAMIHVWMIGTHMSYPVLQYISFLLLVSLFWLESGRLAKTITKKRPSWEDKTTIIATILWLVMTLFLLLLPTFLGDSANHHVSILMEIAV